MFKTPIVGEVLADVVVSLVCKPLNSLTLIEYGLLLQTGPVPYSGFFSTKAQCFFSFDDDVPWFNL